MKTPTAKSGGFTLVEIMIVVAIIGVLAAICIPNFIRARLTSQMNGCINNLRLIDAAKQQWALEAHGVNTSTPTAAQLQPYLGHGSSGELPKCPADSSKKPTFTTSYKIQKISVRPTCKQVTTTHILP